MAVTISQRLRLAILEARARGRRQYALARAAGLHPTLFSAIINSAVPLHPNDARVIQIGRVLGLEPADCFGDVEKDTGRNQS